MLDLGQGRQTERLRLEPLWVAHAAEMGPLLDDASLHEFTGGPPLSTAALSVRYAELARHRSPGGEQLWGNWVMHLRSTGAAVGKSKLAWDDPQYRQLRASIRDACGYPVVDGRRAGRVSFRDAVQCLLDDPGIFDDHWRLQVDLLVADVIDYHVVGRFERFGQQFHAILRRLHAPPEVAGIARRVFNPTQPMPLAAVYDPQLARRVYDFYAADFETFGYHKDSWRDQ